MLLTGVATRAFAAAVRNFPVIGFENMTEGYLALVAEQESTDSPTPSTKDILEQGERQLAKAREALTRMDEALARGRAHDEPSPPAPPAK
jgi:hypothetical protein